LIQVKEALPVDGIVELSIDWPFLLHNACLLQLNIQGRIVDSCERGTAVRIERYEFRTRGNRSLRRAAGDRQSRPAVA